MRTIVDIPEPDLKRLDHLAQVYRVSRAEIVRRAVADYARRQKPDDIFGLWCDAPVDGVDYQQRLRAEWEREWDR